MKFASVFAFFIYFCIVNAAALAQNANELILYEHANFEGESIVLRLGAHENYKAVNNLRDYHHNLMSGVSSFKVGSKVWSGVSGKNICLIVITEASLPMNRFVT